MTVADEQVLKAVIREQWQMALSLAEAEARMRGTPVGTLNGPVAHGASAVVQRIRERLAEIDGAAA